MTPEYDPADDPVVTCPECGSLDGESRETLNAWGRGAQVKCGDCGHVWSWGSEMNKTCPVDGTLILSERSDQIPYEENDKLFTLMFCSEECRDAYKGRRE